MAETLLFSFADSLIRKITSGAVEEASLAFGVHSELQEMKATMTLIRGVLLDAQQKNLLSSALIEWLRRVKRVFSDAENMVDDFECEALRNHVVNTYGGCSRKVRRFFSTSNPLAYRLRMALAFNISTLGWPNLQLKEACLAFKSFTTIRVWCT